MNMALPAQNGQIEKISKSIQISELYANEIWAQLANGVAI